MRGGVLPDWRIKELIEQGVIIGADPGQVNTSSLDLRVGLDKWKLIGSFLPLEGQKIEDVLKWRSIVDDRSTKKDFFVDFLQPYLIKLRESLNLPRSLSGKLFNKSGRARIGTSVKGMTNGTPQFDSIRPGYEGPLYAEVTATSFPIVVYAEETPIPQIRFYEGSPQPISGSELELLLKNHPILTDNEGNPSYNNKEKDEIVRTGKLTFTADLSRDDLIAYVAKRDRRTIDLSKSGEYHPSEFFESITPFTGEERIVTIHPGDFVLIKSKQNIRLPPTVAAEIDEYSPELGDMRSHYAGLINASHGYDPENNNTPSNIVFEIRSRDTPINIQDGQALARFNIYRMLDEPEGRYMDKRSTDFGDLKSILPSVFNKNND